MTDVTGATPNDGFEFVSAEPGVELAVQRYGEGPAVLLVGGLGMPSITWNICGLPQSLVDAGEKPLSVRAGVAAAHTTRNGDSPRSQFRQPFRPKRFRLVHPHQSQRVLRAVVLNRQVDERGGTGEARHAAGTGNRFNRLPILPVRTHAMRKLNRVYRQWHHDVVVTQGDEETVVVW